MAQLKTFEVFQSLPDVIIAEERAKEQAERQKQQLENFKG